MEPDTPHSSFEYSGLLTFRAISGEGTDFRAADLEDNLPKFSQIELGTQSYGFKRLDPKEYENFNNISIDLRSVYTQSDVFRYKREDIGSEIEAVTQQNERISANLISIETGELVITPEGNLLFRGSQNELHNIINHLQQNVSNHYSLRSIEFDSDFLLWVFWHCFQDESIGTGSPLRLNRVELQGERDIFGQSIVYEGEDITQSSVVITHILQNNSIQTIGGLFDFSGLYVDLDINSDGRIHVRVAEDIRKSSQIVRFLSAVQSVDLVTESYTNWKKMPKKRRYPPKSFYFNLRDYIKSEGVKIDFSISDAVERTAKLRGENR